MRYRGYDIEKAGENFAVRKPTGERWPELAANVRTAKKWVDAAIAERRKA